jgi:hypothetical protein
MFLGGDSEARVPAGNGLVVHDDFVSALLSNHVFAAAEEAAGEDVTILLKDGFEWEEGTSHVK